MELFLITLPVFIVIALGYAARSFGVVPKGTASSLANYVYYFALPAYIVAEVGSRPLGELWETNTILAYSGGMIVLAALMTIGGRLCKFDLRFTGMMTLNVIFGSVAYVGVPFTQLAFGTQSAPAVSILIALTIVLSVFWALVLGLGTLELTAKTGQKKTPSRVFAALKKIAFNPLIIAVVVAVALSAASIELPGVMRTTLAMLALTAGPVALFAEGAFLQGKKFWKDWKAAGALSLLKLVALPGLTLLFLYALPTHELNASIALVQAAMPVAATNFIFAQQFNIAPRLVASSTLLSVILSFFTLTLLLYILPMLGL